MLDFIKFQERKILNELAVRIDHESLEKSLTAYKRPYLKEMDLYMRMLEIVPDKYKRNFYSDAKDNDDKKVSASVKRNMKMFQIEDRKDAFKYLTALQSYKGLLYKFINSFLRDRHDFKKVKKNYSNFTVDDINLKPNIRNLDFLIRNEELLKPGIFYRSLGYAGGNLATFDNDIVKKGDKKFADFAYMSCSAKKNLLEKNKTHFRILCPKPFHGIVVGGGESEVLFPRKSRFLINDIKENKNGSKVITMTMFRQKI